MPDPIPEEALQAATCKVAELFTAETLYAMVGQDRELDPAEFARVALDAAAPVLAAQARRDAARALRAVAETREFRRRFIDRHPELHEGVTVCAVLLAVADEIEGEPHDR
jgi:hypothetical protein